jgi:hypothetical protein
MIAFEKFGARFVGYANQEKSHTQTYNCHKVVNFNVGNAIDVTKLSKDKSLMKNTIEPLADLTSEENILIGKNITFHQNLLAKDERISRMDLEYWIDYVYLFGVSDMIPLYDKVDPITFRNWDVYVLGIIILFAVS